MRLEKINENKIRCILTRDDLEVRHIKLSEIAYGSEKARSLFRDMMEQASQSTSESPDDSVKEFLPDGADEVLDLFQKLLEHRLKNTPKETREQQAATLASELDMRKLYLFLRLDSIVEASHILKDIYHGENRLYKNPDNDQYHLVITKSDHTPEEFNKVCNILSEYGASSKYTASNEAYMQEHFSLLLKDRALQQLVEI